MSIPGNANPLLLATAAAAGAADSGRSLRFNSSDSANLHRTPSSAGDRRTWTFAAWIKLSDAGTSDRQVFSTRVSGTAQIQIGQSGSALIGFSESGIFGLRTSRLMRDTGAWFHLCCVFDSTNSTEGDRARVYVNGVRETDFSTETYPSQNAEASWNRTERHNIGSLLPNYTNYFDGYMADIYFIDGSALDPVNNFIEADSNGVYQVKEYTGTFGTNGFHLLDFANESTIGHDSSGNENDFTAVNFSDTAGAGNDVLFDFPQNGSGTDSGAGGELNGNYCTLNELYHPSTLSNGGLDYVSGASNIATVQQVGTVGVSSGKYYFEVTCTASSGSFTDTWFIGLVKSDFDQSTTVYNQSNNVLYYAENGQKYVNSSNSSYGASYTDNDVIGVAADLTGNTIEFFKNGSSQGSISYTFSGTYLPFISNGDDTSSVSATLNFGQRAFTHAAPSNYKTWNTASLPTPTIGDGSDYFDTTLYTGNGSSQTISSLGFGPDWLWFKRRNGDTNHLLFDTVRGAPKRLKTNSNDSESSLANSLTSFNSNGFTINQEADMNGSGNTFVAWAWDAGSSTVTNTDGSVSAQVRASQTAGFSIVTFTNPSSGAFTVGHGLNAQVGLVIMKHRNRSGDWLTWVSGFSNSEYLVLNDTAPKASASEVWGSSAPGSSTFGGKIGVSALAGDTDVAYCFAPVEGYSAFGKYTGSGDADGPFVYTGFRPAFILFKRITGGTEPWVIVDSARDPTNAGFTEVLRPNLTSSEFNNSSANMDILSNGFKYRGAGGMTNASTKDYIFAAFAENPLQANGGLAR